MKDSSETKKLALCSAVACCCSLFFCHFSLYIYDVSSTRHVLSAFSQPRNGESLHPSLPLFFSCLFRFAKLDLVLGLAKTHGKASLGIWSFQSSECVECNPPAPLGTGLTSHTLSCSVCSVDLCRTVHASGMHCFFFLPAH